MPWWNPRRASLVLTFSLVALRPTLHTWVLSWHQVKRVATAARAAPTRAGPGPLRHLVEAQPELRGTKVGGEDAPVVFLLAPPSETGPDWCLPPIDGMGSPFGVARWEQGPGDGDP
ncbi:unnamed protein product [Durusdinium trenchii]|uniref:Uncharacterized protein n=1 Tax=Durusdinium trenchii TaxID=1381693 RepID=A0ABP0I150_9DINO